MYSKRIMSTVLGILTVRALHALYEDLKVVYKLKDGGDADSPSDESPRLILPILQRLPKFPKFDKLPMTPSKESEVEFDELIESINKSPVADSGEADGGGILTPPPSPPPPAGFNLKKLLLYNHF